MYRFLSSLFLIAVGALLLAVVLRGYRVGEVPAGVRWLRPYRPNRDDNPIAFRFYLTLYFCSGVALVVWGILALFGAATPVALR